MKLLIIEDEIDLATAIKNGLLNNYFLKYQIDCAYDGEEALDKYFTNNYDLILLDLNLPIIDGLDLLDTIRNDNKEIPILILSARINIDDKVLGLDLGANDYLAKPFDFKELEARINALLRQYCIIKSQLISVENVTLDTKNNILYDENNEIINLTKKEHQILSFLMRNKGLIFNEYDLVDNIWDDDTDNTSFIRVHINSIRKKLNKPNIIKNKRGSGYYV
ncbi:MAG: response regulator transcription factor [Bacilli bacterium]|jgi:DNA-binding response OmpR family regulator|nr:response regulator transcription factor [Bacilli bacterium]